MGLAKLVMINSEKSICPVCKNNAESKYFEHWSDFANQNYSLYHCQDCDIKYWEPLHMLKEVYEDSGYQAYDDYHGGKRPYPPWCTPFHKYYDGPAGKLLDVGCADGAFMSRAAESGFDVYGIDLDARSIDYAKKKRRLTNTFVSTLSDFSGLQPGNKFLFETITFFEVLEHQTDPLGFLLEVSTFLQPGGYIAGSVPNRNRFLSKLDRMFGGGDMPPHHFLWFSRKGLEKLLEKSNFHVFLIKASGNIPFGNLHTKLVNLVLNKILSGTTMPGFARKIVQPVLYISLLPVALMLQAGLTLLPPHLYFQAKYKK